MKRFVIITVGKTHSGKTTFARFLEQKLSDSLVIDQDNHAEFINTYYKTLQPKQGPNTLKHTLTQTIVDYAIEQTTLHLIICNSNLARKGRLELLHFFKEKGFITILVNFDIPAHILQARVRESQRKTTIFRSLSTFEEVLASQQNKSNLIAPTKDEADYLYVIQNSNDIQYVSQQIVTLAQNSSHPSNHSEIKEI